jgi:hypothetical protein
MAEKKRMLSGKFLEDLKGGFLSDITENVIADPDLNLEIRENYINVYYKGNSLLKLTETAFRYKAEIHAKYLDGLTLPPEYTKENISQFLDAIPLLKHNIVRYGKRSIEIEYEQMIIRANNYEYHNNTEYFIVDRQYAIPEGRLDLTGVFWRRDNRQNNRQAQVCLMEVKYALNPDIGEVHAQLQRYYDGIAPLAPQFAGEMQTVFRQKLDLGLYNQSAPRLSAMKTLTFVPDIKQFQFILVLVDYNPYSSKLDLGRLAALSFADQIKVFESGFGMWQNNVKHLSQALL